MILSSKRAIGGEPLERLQKAGQHLQLGTRTDEWQVNGVFNVLAMYTHFMYLRCSAHFGNAST